MSFTKITSRVIAPGAVTAEALAPGVGGGPAIANVQIANSSYTLIDDTAVSLDGGYIIINGENFDVNVQVLVGNTVATSVTYVSENQVRAQIGSSSAGSKIVYLVNTDTGSTAIRVNGLTYSGTPTWVTGSTLTESLTDEAISIQLSATSDSNVSYSLASGSSLPSGLSLAANGLLSGTVTGLENDTTYNFTIEATDQELQNSPRSFSVNILVSDPFFNRNVLLLSGDGTNGAQNNTFLDGSTNNFTITRNGNTTQGTFSPFSLAAGEWSNYFDGNGDFLTVANNAALDITNANFCVEAWIYRTTSGVEQYLISQRAGNGWEWRINATNLMVFFYTAGSSITSVSTIPVNQWTHVAVTRDGSNGRLFINGVVDATATFSNGTATTSSLRIGYTTDPPAGYFQGYLSNVRIVKGSAVYTAAFTPPTAPLTNITNTSLLTCQSNRFVDNSTNAFAITRNGDVRVTPFSPFAPSAAYSAGTNGGSGYFDGTGDYLNFTGTNFDIGTGALTIEAWIYLNAYGFSGIISTWNSTNTGQGFSLTLDSSGKPEFHYGNGSAGQSVSVVASSAIPLNTWVHLAATKGAGSGGTMTLYVNGVSVGTPVTTTKSIDREAVVIGRYYQDLNLYYLNGYISNIRVSDTVRSISISTAPYTSDANTLFLANFTNAGIFDNTGKNNLETVGNAQIDTTTKKYGTGSLEFDGSGDSLLTAPNVLFDLGTSSFTIEFWIYPLNFSTTRYALYSTSARSKTDAIALEINTSGQIAAYATNSGGGAWSMFSGQLFGTLTANTWNHVALVRNGTQFRGYVNGVQGALSSTSSNAIAFFDGYNIGTNGAGGGFFNGFIDDLRITKGVARYTANFTAPTRAHRLK